MEAAGSQERSQLLTRTLTLTRTRTLSLSLSLSLTLTLSLSLILTLSQSLTLTLTLTLTEADFQRTPLDFVRSAQAIMWNNGSLRSIEGQFVDGSVCLTLIEPYLQPEPEPEP